MISRSTTTSNFLSHSWESVAPLVFPPVCVLCGDATEPTPAIGGEVAGESSQRRRFPQRQYETFCRTCETSLIQSSPMMRTACEECGWPRGARTPRAGSVGSGAESSLDENFAMWGEGGRGDDVLPCARCHARKTPHRFNRITPLYRYHDAARDAVVAAKYPHNSVVARELAIRLAVRCLERWTDLVAEQEAVLSGGKSRRGWSLSGINPLRDGNRLNQAGDGPMITSVPSPWIRQVRRGGSGTRLLSQYTALHLGLPYVSLLRTCRQISKQALLDDDGRRANVSGAFRVCRGSDKKISGREVILVDDVMTTGATADEIAGVLLDAGASKVSLAVVAMALREN